MVDNIIGYKFFIDKYKEIPIEISSTSNFSGILTKDVNGNFLNNVEKGTQRLKSCTSFPYNKPMLLYNDLGYEIIDGKFSDYSKFLNLLKTEHTKYGLGFERLSTTTHSNFKFMMNLTGYNVYKVYLNGSLLLENSYEVSSSGVTITGFQKFGIRENSQNKLTVLAYLRNENIIGTTTFTYEGVDRLDLVSILNSDLSQFDNSLKITQFQEYTTTQNKTLYQYKQNFGIISRDIVNDINNQMNIQLYDESGAVDLREYAGNSRFRIVGINLMTKKIKIYTNCKISSGVQESLSLNPTTKTYSIDYEDKIDTNIADLIAYGDGHYSAGYYGGFHRFSDGGGFGGSNRT